MGNYILKNLLDILNEYGFIFFLILSILLMFIIIFLRYFLVRVFWNFDLKRIRKILYRDYDYKKFISKSVFAQKRYGQPVNKIPFTMFVGLGYVVQGDILAGIKYMKTIDIEKCDIFLKAEYYIYLSYYYCLLKDLDNAKLYFNLGEKFFYDKSLSIDYSHLTMRTLGYIELLQGNYIVAEKILLDLKEKLINDTYLIITINIILAKIYIKIKKFDEAKILLESISRENLFPIDKVQVEELFKELIF